MELLHNLAHLFDGIIPAGYAIERGGDDRRSGSIIVGVEGPRVQLVLFDPPLVLSVPRTDGAGLGAVGLKQLVTGARTAQLFLAQAVELI